MKLVQAYALISKYGGIIRRLCWIMLDNVSLRQASVCGCTHMHADLLHYSTHAIASAINCHVLYGLGLSLSSSVQTSANTSR
jgi:hypothetical protein